MDLHAPMRPAGPMPDERVPIGERVHAVEELEKSHFKNTETHRLGQMQEMFGLALPMRHQFTERLLMGQRRLAPLESSYLHLDTFRGDHTQLAWEDYLQDPMYDDRVRKNTHVLMEEQLFGRVLQPVHTKDVI